MRNLDLATVKGFGEEWSKFDQSELSTEERAAIFEDYFSLFPEGTFHPLAEGADVGCGSGRWASLVAPRVGTLWAVDASSAALDVARRNLEGMPEVKYLCGEAGHLPFPDAQLDFAYSLGVLHHLPDTAAAIRELGRVLKDGAPVLIYLYYNFENRPLSFRALWQLSNILRLLISRAPKSLRFAVCDLLAVALYWPLARAARLTERMLGRSVPSFPLRYYGDKSFYVMRTDSLDRFGTRLERRFSRAEISEMLEAAGFSEPIFSPAQPYWTVVARRRARS